MSVKGGPAEGGNLPNDYPSQPQDNDKGSGVVNLGKQNHPGGDSGTTMNPQRKPNTPASNTPSGGSR